MDERTSPNRPGWRWARSGGLIAAGLIAGGILAGTLSAVAQANSAASATTATATTATATTAAPSNARHWRGEKPLTGTTAAKVRTAALAAVPGGTILRVETDSDGSPYEAHVRKTDGTEVTVKVNRDFKVTSIETHGVQSATGSA
jgi:hypothetical protein